VKVVTFSRKRRPTPVGELLARFFET